MPIKYKKKVARLSGTVGVEEAETLISLLLQHPRMQIDLDGCEHLHCANLQILMAYKPEICSWPKNETLKTWLQIATRT